MASVPPAPPPDRARSPIARSGSDPTPATAATDPDSEAIELELGGAEDYGVDLLGLEADEGSGAQHFGLSFAPALAEDNRTGAWDLASLSELVVQETRGVFDGHEDARHDATVMEGDFDPEDEVLLAVWAPTTPGGAAQVGAKVRRRPRTRSLPAEYLPYGVIAGLLAGLLALVLVGVALLALLAVINAAPRQLPPEPPPVPVAPPPGPSQPPTADEILREVLGEEAAPP